MTATSRRAIRTLYGIDRARRIQRSLEPQCLSGFRKDENSRILRSDVLIVADAGDFVFLRLRLRGAVAVAGADQRRHHRAVDDVQ